MDKYWKSLLGISIICVKDSTMIIHDMTILYSKLVKPIAAMKVKLDFQIRGLLLQHFDYKNDNKNVHNKFESIQNEYKNIEVVILLRDKDVSRLGFR